MRHDLLGRFLQYVRLRKSLRQLDKISPLTTKRVFALLTVYRRAFDDASQVITYLINNLKYTGYKDDRLATLSSATFAYLGERILSTPHSIIHIISHDPFYAHADTAALNRSLFDNIVNFLYLASDTGVSRFCLFLVRSYDLELRFWRAMEPWTKSQDKVISTRAKAQYFQEHAPSEETLAWIKKTLGFESQKIPSYPSIKQRCAALGDKWAFNYDQKYRGLSSWQHGDMTRIYASWSLSQAMPEQKDRLVFEALVELVWAWDLFYDFGIDLCSLVGLNKQLKILELINQSSLAIALENFEEARQKYQRTKH